MFGGVRPNVPFIMDGPIPKLIPEDAEAGALVDAPTMAALLVAGTNIVICGASSGLVPAAIGCATTVVVPAVNAGPKVWGFPDAMGIVQAFVSRAWGSEGSMRDTADGEGE